MSTATPLERLFAKLWDLFLDAGALDGPELSDMIARAGLAAWREATEDDAHNTHLEIEVGDPLLCLTDEGKRVVFAARQSGDDDHG